ncbi:hypothetical protein LCGC14_1031980, partial [marine sediment metagenome]
AFTRARDLVEQSIARDPQRYAFRITNAKILISLAQLELPRRLENISEALTAMQQAIQLNPTSVRLRIDHAKMLLQAAYLLGDQNLPADTYRRTAAEQLQQALKLIDAIGVGGAVVDAARETLTGANIRAVNFGGKSEATDKSGVLLLGNARAEAYWNIREMMEDGVLMIPDDPELIADLAAPRYRPVAGKIRLEVKAQIKKRIGRSPDAGDAVALALFRYGQYDMMAWLGEQGYGGKDEMSTLRD